MRQYFGQLWQNMAIKKKILMFTAAVIVACLLSVILNIWVVKFSLVDYSTILEENALSVDLVQVLENEKNVFQNYVLCKEDTTDEMYEEAVKQTKEVVDAMPFDYRKIGEERYAQTWSIRNSYRVYVTKRDAFLQEGRDNPDYIHDRYSLYEMQDYMISYAKELMTNTLEVGSVRYQEKIPSLSRIFAVVLLFAAIIFLAIVNLARLMNRSIIVPVMKLAEAAKRIAENDFYVEDVQVENQDELGELVHAFNKMKFSTSEYIIAMEEKRETLDMLHNEEVQRLEAERRLETMRLEALKNQINPHFLFNTLNVIGGMAMLENASTTGQMIKALSSLFRYNLQSSESVTTLMRELKIVRDYMYIQKMRFGDRVDYEIQCLVDEEETLVPTFTFQPLIENAVIHGLGRKEEGGRIAIRIWEVEEDLKISVADTGVGMSQEILQTVKEKLKEDYSNANIGIGNVYRRIKLAFPSSEMDIKSKENEGTEIEITIRK